MNEYIELFAAITLFLNALIALVTLMRTHHIAKDVQRIELQGNSARDALTTLNRALGVSEGRDQMRAEQHKPDDVEHSP